MTEYLYNRFPLTDIIIASWTKNFSSLPSVRFNGQCQVSRGLRILFEYVCIAVWTKKLHFNKKSYIIYPCLYRDQHLLEIARNLEQREWLNLLKFDWLNLINKLKLDENRYETANRMYSGEWWRITLLHVSRSEGILYFPAGFYFFFVKFSVQVLFKFNVFFLLFSSIFVNETCLQGFYRYLGK